VGTEALETRNKMKRQSAVKKAAVAIGSSGSSGAGGITTVPTGTVGSGVLSGAVVVVAPTGLCAHLQQMLLWWQALTQTAVVTELSTYLSAYSALDAAKLGEQNARTAVTEQEADAQAYVVRLKEALVGFFGSGKPALAQFGLKPRTARGAHRGGKGGQGCPAARHAGTSGNEEQEAAGESAEGGTGDGDAGADVGGFRSSRNPVASGAKHRPRCGNTGGHHAGRADRQQVVGTTAVSG
jgi:hypothetical protein